MGDPSTSSASGIPHSVFPDLVRFLKDIPQPNCVQSNLRSSSPTSTDADVSAQCLYCDGCRSANKLSNMREQAAYIESTFAKMSIFEHDLGKHMEAANSMVNQGGRNLAGEPSFEVLVRAVEHFKFQLPYTSLYEFPGNDQGDACPPHPVDTVSETMTIRYNSLSDLQKKCLLYCSVFNGAFKKRVLINWWIGEGLLQEQETSLETEGEGILKILEEREFIVPVYKTEQRAPNTWGMEPSFQQLLRSKLDEQLTEAVLLRSNAQIDRVDINGVKKVFNVNKSTVGSNESKIVACMENLQVLHLGRSQTRQHVQVKASKLILEGLRKMKQLRLLSLEGIASIRQLLFLPTSLMVLDLRGCQALELLPSSIGSLKNLRHMDVSDCYILRQMPREIRFLSKLEVLKGFIVGHKGSCSLEDLGMLKKLHKLSICVLRGDFPQHPDLVNLANIQGLVKLKILWRLIASTQAQQSQTEIAKPLRTEGAPNNADSGVQVQPTEIAEPLRTEGAPNNADSGVQVQPTEIAEPLRTEGAPNNADSGVQVQPTEIAEPLRTEGAPNNADSGVQVQPTEIAEPLRTEGAPNNADSGVQVQPTEIAEPLPTEGAPNNADSGEKVQANGVLNNISKLVTCCFRNQTDEETQNADVLRKLEKLDVWCAPACAGNLLLASQRFPSLKQLYITGGALQNLQTNPWLKVEKLRLLFLTHFHMRWGERISLFPALSFLEMQNCPKLDEFSQNCNQEGVWISQQ